MDTKKGAPAVDVIGALTAVYNDVAKYGVLEGSTFVKGWICPIYKLKKDKREIGNYRPITLLNSDYKIMTKTLATRLANVASTVIHTDQAGFVPGRRIFDHIKLSQLMIEYAEAEEVNGAIVALDQEKAYDKVNHVYLWRVLRHMNFPENFIRTLRNLYAKAESCVIVNGVKSSFFRIRRGVRQGDPISCLIFNLAIEPLACAIRKSSLRGFCVPGEAERLVAKLFADDTTIYLSEEDDYDVVTNLTAVWCRASRARFNREKTEILPVGTPEYRTHFLETRKLGERAAPFPNDVHIVKDGEAIRSLGAWIGNGTNMATSWQPILATIERNLEKWGQSKPSLYGRKLIIGMEVGGRTQFLTMAQTMPVEIEQKVTKMIASFMWNGDNHPRVARDTLYRPTGAGGLKLLDRNARNEAIDMMWLKSYLNLSRERPLWALLADVLLANAAAAESRSADRMARTNVFLQSWRVSTRKKAGLPTDLRRMVKVAEKYGVRCEVRKPTKNLRNEFPIWYHVGIAAGRCTANSKSSKCLREHHKVLTVAQCHVAAQRLTTAGTAHRPTRSCDCPPCIFDREEQGCDNPHRCAEAARRAVERLYPKWRPTEGENKDGLTLTRRRMRNNLTARAADERILFDPSISQGTPLAMAFRVFVREEDRNETTATREVRPYEVQAEEIEVFTDGSCVNNGRDDARAGSGVWFGVNDSRNCGVGVPYDSQSNQAAEIYAVAVAHRRVPPFAALHIVSDSKYVVDGFTKHLRDWERKGWLGVSNAAIFRDTVALLRTRCAPTTFRWVKGHSGVLGNEEADKLAAAGAALPPPIRPIDLPAPKSFTVAGASLSHLTQRLAYRGIKTWKQVSTRPSTQRTTELAQQAVQDATGARPTSASIWCMLRRDPIAKKVRDFLWKALHGAHRVGAYWKHIPEYETRAMCSNCGRTDSMEHILTECEAPGRVESWRLANSLLSERGFTLQGPSYGLILGCQAVELLNDKGERRTGLTRFTKMIISETAYFIWTLRCERVIGWASEPARVHTRTEIERRWLATINKRLGMDCALTSKRVAGRKALPVDHVTATWQGSLLNEADLPANWIGLSGVLVGKPTSLSSRGYG